MWFGRKAIHNNKNKQANAVKNSENSKDNSTGDRNADAVWMRRIVSHNVRMPMAIIRGYGDVLKQGLLDEKEKQEAIEDICANIMYLDQIISVIFDEEYENGKKLLTKVNISEVLRNTTRYVEDMAKKNNIGICLKTENNEMYIMAEFTPIMRVFYQILENAFKYLVSGNNVSISAYSVEKEILVVYKDDGIGMKEEEVGEIFNKGFRGSNSKDKPGSGLGLYDVSEIVRKYGGTIEIKSREGLGFSAFIRFPKTED